MVPVCSIGSRLWVWILIAGAIFQAPALASIGILLFSLVVLFQLVTLPVEFDASNRARAVLARTGIVNTQAEHQGVSSVLNAAAMTYVAAALQAVATLIYLIARRRD